MFEKCVFWEWTTVCYKMCIGFSNLDCLLLERTKPFIRFEVLISVTVKSSVFLEVMPSLCQTTEHNFLEDGTFQQNNSFGRLCDSK